MYALFFHLLVSFSVKIIKDVHKDATTSLSYSVIFYSKNNKYPIVAFVQLIMEHLRSDILIDNVIVYQLPMKHVADLIFKRE